MTQQLNRLPDAATPLSTKGAITSAWWRLWSGLFTGAPTGNVSMVTAGASPFTYIASVGGTLIVNGGSTTQIQYSRDGNNFYTVGQTSGMFPLSQGDQLRISYSLAPPTMTFAPR